MKSIKHGFKSGTAGKNNVRIHDAAADVGGTYRDRVWKRK